MRQSASPNSNLKLQMYARYPAPSSVPPYNFMSSLSEMVSCNDGSAGANLTVVRTCDVMLYVYVPLDRRETLHAMCPATTIRRRLGRVTKAERAVIPPKTG